MKTFEEFKLLEPGACHELREIGEHELAHEAKIIGTGPESDPNIRSASRYKVTDAGVIDWIIDAVDKRNRWNFATHWGTEMLPHAELIRYGPDDLYKPHTDWSPTYAERKISVTVQLSLPEEYEGGRMLLYDGPTPWPVTTEQGWGTMFPSWTLHEVEPVTSGERWALVAWILGPSFT